MTRAAASSSSDSPSTPPAPGHSTIATLPSTSTPSPSPGSDLLPLHSDVGVRRYYMIQAMATIFPLTAGLILYGWRALLAIALVLIGSLGGLAIWGRIGMRGQRIGATRTLWLSLLLALMLPAHLASNHYPGGPSGIIPWPILPAAGLALVMLLWLLSGIGSGRLHPVPVIYLLLVVIFQPLLTPHLVLNRARIVTGDLTDAAMPRVDPSGAPAPVRKEAWTSYTDRPSHDARYSDPASEQLVAFTTGRQTPARAALSLEELLRDTMPPLEDLIVAGAPQALGLGSAIAIIMGGLFLLYRGVIDFRIPLLICITAVIAMLFLPIPVAVTENTRHWRSLALHAGVGWPVAITFISYELMAGPLLFVAFFLAGAPGIRPLTRRGRAIYAILIGAGAAALQLYLDVSYGPYLALLIVALSTPILDRLFIPRPLV